MLFDSDTNSLTGGFAKGEPTSWDELFQTSVESGRRARNVNANVRYLSDAYDERIDKIKAATGEDLSSFHPFRAEPSTIPFQRRRTIPLGAFSPDYDPPRFEDRFTLFDQELNRLQQKRPDFADVIRADRSPVAEIAEKVMQAQAGEAKAGEGRGFIQWDMPGSSIVTGPLNLLRDPYGMSAVLLGSLRAQLESPVDLGIMLASGAAGNAAKSLLKNAIANARANMLGQAAIEPIISANRQQLGLDYTLGESIDSILGAGSMGAILDLGVRGPVRAFRQQYPNARIPILGREERVGGMFTDAPERLPDITTAPQPAPERSPTSLISQDVAERAARGDDAAIVEVARTLGLDRSDDPSIRGALAVREADLVVQRELDARYGAGAIDSGEGLSQLAKAIAAVEDPDAPHYVRPAEPVPESRVRLPDDTTPRELGTNQHQELVASDGRTIALKDIDLKSLDLNRRVARLEADAKFSRDLLDRVMVYERADGTVELLDGNRRAALAKASPEEKINAPALVFKESAGWTLPEARELAARENIRRGDRLDPVAIADSIRAFPGVIDKSVDITPQVQAARALATLSDEAFAMIKRGEASVDNGVLVADHVFDTTRHSDVLANLQRFAGDDPAQAKAILPDLYPPDELAATDALLGVTRTPEMTERGIDGGLKISDPGGAEAKKQTQLLQQNLTREIADAEGRPERIAKAVEKADTAIEKLATKIDEARAEGKDASKDQAKLRTEVAKKQALQADETRRLSETAAQADRLQNAIAATAAILPDNIEVRTFRTAADLPAGMAEEVIAANQKALAEAVKGMSRATTPLERAQWQMAFETAMKGEGIEGFAFKDQIWIAEYAANPDAKIAHEVVHALKTNGQLTADEIGMLAARSRDLGLFDETLRPEYVGIFNERADAKGLQGPEREAFVKGLMDEEAAAYLIEAAKRGMDVTDPAARTIVGRLLAYFKRIAAYFKAQGMDTADDVINTILSGEAAKRELVRRAEVHPAELTGPLERYPSVEDGGAMMALADRPVTPGLDMSPEARKQRAEAMGFDTSTRYYHTTSFDFDAFDLQKSGKALGPSFAKDYPAYGGLYDGANIGVYYLRGKRLSFETGWEVRPRDLVQYLIDGKYEDWDGNVRPVGLELSKSDKELLANTLTANGWSVDRSATVRQVLTRNGIDGIEFAHEGMVETIPFSVNDIRSVNAAFDPANADSPNLMFALSDRATGQEMRRDLDSLGFYSKALEAARSLRQAKGTPEQMLAQLKSAGVKDAEIEATNLRSVLDGKKAVTRDEIVSHLEKNRVGLREVNRSREANSAGLVDFFGGRSADVASAPKWQAYSLDPSNPTYRETVLHLPENETPPTLEEFKQKSGVSDAIAQKAYDKFIAEWPRSREQFGFDSQSFRSGHFPEPNIVGHMMTSMVKHEGKPTFLFDQIQSDWGQKLRDGGVRDEAKIAELKKRVASLNAEADALAADREMPSNRIRNEKRWFENRNERDLLDAELRTAEAAALGHPLVNTTDQWTNTTLRRALRIAAEADADYIAIPHGDTVLSYNPGDNEGMRGFYGTRSSEGIVPKNLRKLLEKIDKDAAKPVKVTELETSQGRQGFNTDDTKRSYPFDEGQTGFTLFPLTEKVKAAVRDKGQPMFAFADLAVRNNATSIDDIGPKDPHPGRVLAAHGTRAAFSDRFDVAQSNDIGIHFGGVEQANQFAGRVDRETMDRLTAAVRREQDAETLDDTVARINALSVQYTNESERLAALSQGWKRWLGLSDAKKIEELKASTKELARRIQALEYDAFKRRDEQFAVTGTKDARIFPVVLDMTNVLTMDDMGTWPVERVTAALNVPADDRKAILALPHAEQPAALREWIVSQGYDGIRYRNSVEGEGWSYIAIKPNTVTSALTQHPMFAFAGERARTADLQTLSEAKKMAEDGASREDIWKATGWFRGVDGKWRWEIDDSGLTAQPNAPGLNIGTIGSSFGGVDNILAAYPDMGDMGAFLTYGPRMKRTFGTQYPDHIEARGNASDLALTGVHEMQHVIQDRERFAQGGSPSDRRGITALPRNDQQRIAIAHDIANATAESLGITKAEDVSRAEWSSAVDRVAKEMAPPNADEVLAVGNRRKIYEQAIETAKDVERLRADVEALRQSSPMDRYVRLAGEVESRAVEKRLRMSPEERRARPPWLDYDVPEDQQIVRMSGGGSSSSEPMFSMADRGTPDEPQRPDLAPLIRSYTDAYGAVLQAAAERGITADTLPAIVQAVNDGLNDPTGSLPERLMRARQAIEDIIGPDATDRLAAAVTETLPYVPGQMPKIDTDALMATAQRVMDALQQPDDGFKPPKPDAANDNLPETPLTQDLKEVAFFEEMAMLIGSCRA